MLRRTPAKSACRIGFNEPNALAIIGNDGSGDNHIFHLYVREKDPKAELWDGARSGTQAAVDVFNADEVRDIGLRIRQITELTPRTDRKH